MKPIRILFVFLAAFFFVSSAAVASDFGWTKNFNVQAQADPSGFQARLATRFKLGDADVKVILSNFDSPADAYIALRLGEMSGRPAGYVVDKYKEHKGKGWGVLAGELGIKQGSEEFHALKRGHDMDGSAKNSKDSGSDHGKNKNNGKGKGEK